MKNNLKTHMLISNVLMIAGVLLAIAGLLLQQGKEGIHFLVWVALGLAVGSVVYKILTLKCPHCGAFLPVKYKLPTQCLNCGKTLTEDSIHEKTDS